MDVITDAVFWGDVGLALASKLALIAAGLWGMKMIMTRRLAVPEQIPAPVALAAAEARPVARRIPANRVAALEIAGVARTPGERAGAGESKVRSGADRDRMRKRLMEYLEQQQAERRGR